MEPKRFTGPHAGSQKYDLLTAISVAGLNGTNGFQCSMMRLIALITARYNWRSDELTVGQREMARLWSVDERTVKREIKRLTERRILLQLRPGVRGRVAAYRLNCSEIYRLSEPVWCNVGPDFASRMEMQNPEPAQKVVHVKFGQQAADASEPEELREVGPWGRVLSRLLESEAALFRNWFSELKFVGTEGPSIILRAPNKFVAQYVQTHYLRPLLGAIQLEFGSIRRVCFVD
ncbi:DnaA N-terminal domain-containing protein [Ruegeria sp. HKCCD8929]|uniref:DnaA N-terminal domain-containing protein n=1 Tax=Ruegeria sp. HKCCD8929 TaxID=2683006 RepID=UPI001489BEA6|nr:DnaA N-terminal domain-containing protein [Ruegeria sp. HKCCD8929]